MANVSMNEKRCEALKRLKMIGVDKNMVIKPFQNENVMLSEYMDKYFCAVLFDVNQYEYLKHAIHLFENEYNSLVYHVQLSHLDFGDCYSFFYVSDYKDEWDMDRYDLLHGFAVVYVWNKNAEELSEFGSIDFATKMGGIVRMY